MRVRNEDGEIVDAIFVRQHRNGEYIVRYEKTGKIEKNVRRDRVESIDQSEEKRRKRTVHDKRERESGELELDAIVQFKDETGEWQEGRIRRIRKNAKFDIASEEGNIVKRKIARRDIRTSRYKTIKTSDKVESGEDARIEAEQREKVRKPREESSGGEDKSSDDDSEAISDRGRRGHAPRPRGVALRVHQWVEFEDKSGRLRRGRIHAVNRDLRQCDIVHANDVAKVSKRIPFNVIRPLSTLSRVFGTSHRTLASVQLHTHVYYRTNDGEERKGIVLKIAHTSGKPRFDVEDLHDGTLVPHRSIGQVRPVPWLDLSSWQWQWPAPCSCFGAPLLRPGVSVRFRSKRNDWQDGVIRKAKTNHSCLVEYMGENGVLTRKEVPNDELHVRFWAWPTFSNPMTRVLEQWPLASLPMLSPLVPVASAVEVSNGVHTFFGTVASVNAVESTYTIRYEDGRKEKNVASDRVRVSLRRLQLGTDVELIVEGPCKEVSKLEGEVAWVHRDEKVAIRIHGGTNDVFAEVCTHALMVQGTPAFTAPLSRTWVERMGYYCNLATEVGIYAWFLFGLGTEVATMGTLYVDLAPDLWQDPAYMTVIYQVQNSTGRLCAPHNATATTPYLLLPADVMATDRAWLLVLLILKALLSVTCALFVLRCVRSKLAALQDDFIDLKEYHQERVLRRHLATMMGYALITTFLTLVDYASLLNRFDFYCLLTDKSLSFAALALTVDPFAIHTKYASPVLLLTSLAAKTTFNLFRGIAFHVLLFAFPCSGTHFLRRLVLLVPSILVTALICAIGGAALHTFYYVQKMELMRTQNLDLTRPTDLALVLVALSLWVIHCLYNVVAAAGRFYDSRDERQRTSRHIVSADVLALAERGEFGLQAQREALVTKVEQRQDELGVWKLSILRIYRYLGVHLVVAVSAISIDVTLRHRIKQESGNSVASHALAFHLAMSLTWLVGCGMVGLIAGTIRAQVPDVLAYILDV